MTNLIQKLKSEIIALSQKLEFIHHEWFVKYHLEIVEKISLELCEIYPHADKNVVLTMVWVHDYGKIIDFDTQHASTLSEAPKLLSQIGFGEEFITRIVSYIEIMDKKVELESEKTPIEVKIVSSADGVSHFFGPFFPIYLYEYSSQPLADLLVSNTDKALSDFNKKIVLQEVKKLVKQRLEFILESNGKLPNKFLI